MNEIEICHLCGFVRPDSGHLGLLPFFGGAFISAAILYVLGALLTAAGILAFTRKDLPI